MLILTFGIEVCFFKMSFGIRVILKDLLSFLNVTSYSQFFFFSISALVQPSKCITFLRSDLGTCMAKYNIDPEIFLVNVTHDRTNILGSKARANMFCT